MGLNSGYMHEAAKLPVPFFAIQAISINGLPLLSAAGFRSFIW